MRHPTREENWRLFQARMWREYAMEWDQPKDSLRYRWVEGVLRLSRAECIQRARDAWTKPYIAPFTNSHMEHAERMVFIARYMHKHRRKFKA